MSLFSIESKNKQTAMLKLFQDDRQHKPAFTLAEVLITLTIIGIIAAMTIPNLMQSWRKYERITQIKSAYSIIQNAIKMSVADNGSTSNWAYLGDTYKFTETYIIPYLKVQKKCGMTTNSTKFIQTGCFYYDTNDFALANGTWFFLNGQTSAKKGSGGYNSSFTYTMKLQNGMDLGVLAIRNFITFIFDVNGALGPTIAGNDVFAFMLNTDTGKFSTGQTYAWTSDIYFCQKTSRHGGMNCAHDIELNHWEFPDDYPIKKF